MPRAGRDGAIPVRLVHGTRCADGSPVPPFLHVADALGASKAPYASIVRSAPFVALDALVAAALFALAAIHAEAAKAHTRANKVVHKTETEETEDVLPHFTACAYLLNPMSVLSCAAGSTSALGTFRAGGGAACKKPEPLLAGACLAASLFVDRRARPFCWYTPWRRSRAVAYVRVGVRARRKGVFFYPK